MRSYPLRLALPLAALVAAVSFSRLAAADAEPAAAPAATSDASDKVSTPADGSAKAAPEVATPAMPSDSPAKAPAAETSAKEAPPPAVADQDTADAKLAVVLRSYTLLRDENDQLKAAQEKNALEKSALEAQLGVAKGALPLASQAAALREQLRQTQDQLAALSLENNQLKTRLATGAPAPGTANLTPVNVPTSLPPAAAPAAPAERFHVVVAGETLGKISQQYYGTATRWREILAANRGVLKDEKSVFVGAKLRIP